MLICGLDLESTGLDTENDEIIELGAVLWDTESSIPCGLFSVLVKPDKPISPEITKITGLTNEILAKYALPKTVAYMDFSEFAKEAECFVAHNGNMFDKPMLASNLKRTPGLSIEVKGHWIDTSCDVPYPEKIKTRNLVHLAAEHGFLNPFAHRALFDVLTMLKVLSFYDFGKVLALSKEPSFVIQAQCEKPWEDGGKSTEEAKANGFRWDGKSKRWLKTIRESQRLPEMEKAKLYKITEVTP
jgi:DNA polymerase III subunit epsilon